MTEQQTVFLVEDDRGVRESLQWILEHEGLAVLAFASPSDLLTKYDATRPGCLVLDLFLPEMNGMELRDKLVADGCQHPFIIITAHGRIPDATNAMRRGAINFLQKPLDHDRFVSSVWEAIDTDARWRREEVSRASVSARLQLLTAREREVLDLVVSGKLTKHIARDLGVSVKTIEAHRSRITKKMQAECVVQLVRMMADYSNHRRHPIPQPHVSTVVSTPSAVHGSVN